METHDLLERQTCSQGDDYCHMVFSADTTLELTTVATGGGYKMMTGVQYVLQLILCSYGLVHLYVCLHFSQLEMAPCTIC